MSKMENTFVWGTNSYTYKFIYPLKENMGSVSIIDNYYAKLEDVNNKLDTTIFNEFKNAYDNKQLQQDNLIAQKANTSDLSNYYTKLEIDEQQNSQNESIATNTSSINNIKWVPLTNITRGNNTTTINLEGKRFIHLQGHFTAFTTATGSWMNFTPFMIDTQNYNYPIRITLKDWNTQTIKGSVQINISGNDMLLDAYDINNNRINYYLWGDVLGRN